LGVHAGEHVQHFPLPRLGVTDAIGGHQRNAHAAGLLHNGLVAGFLAAVDVALQFGIEMMPAEYVRQAFVDIRRDGDQAARKLRDLIQRGGAFAFLGAHFHARHQAAQVAVALAIFAQKWVALAVGARDFGADMRAYPRLLRRHVEARRAVHAVPVEQRHGGNAQVRAGGHQIFGRRGALQKTEGRASVKFNIRSRHNTLYSKFLAASWRAGFSRL
jgi:hypothetical protein